MRRCYTLLALFLVAACTSETNRVTESVLASSVKLDTNQFGVTSSLGGVLKAPSGIVATGGGNLVATGGGSLVATGGGSFRSFFGLLAINEVPVISASISLTNLKRAPLPEIAAVVTDAQGNFRFDKVPRGETVLMTSTLKTSNGKACYFQSLAKAGAGLEIVDINSASTIVSTFLLSRIPANEVKDLGSLDMSLFREVTGLVGRGLSSDQLPDFADEAAIVKQMEKIESESPAIRQLMIRLEQALAPKKERFSPLAGAPTAPGTPAPVSVAPSAGSPAPGGGPTDTPPLLVVPASNLVATYDFPSFEGEVAECSDADFGKAQLSETTVTFLPDSVTNQAFAVDELQICRYVSSQGVGNASFVPIEGSVVGFDSASKKWTVKLPPNCSIVFIIRSGADVFALENIKFTSALSFKQSDFKIRGTKRPSPSPSPAS